MSPTSRTMQQLRCEGWHPEPVERWLPRVGIRKDFLGMFDLLALKIGEPLLAIQTTSASNHSTRVKKLLASPLLALWLQCGQRAEVWSWSQHKGRWQARREALELQDAQPIAVEMTPRRRPRRARKGERQGDLFAAAE